MAEKETTTRESLQAWAAETGCQIEDDILVSVPEDTSSLVIPEGIRVLGDHAFTPRHRSFQDTRYPKEGFTAALEQVTLPESLEKIGELAFWRCARLRSLELPEGVRVIEREAFMDCFLLETLRLPRFLSAIEPGTFLDCRSLRQLQIPEGTESIGWMACRGCENLETLTLPEGLKEIREFAFQGCRSLRRLELPGSVECILRDAFRDCSALEELRFGGNLRSVARYAFAGCDRLGQITGPDLLRFAAVFQDTPYGRAKLPRGNARLPAEVVGSHDGTWLRDRGYGFFEEGREYSIGVPDENGVVEVSSWSRTEGPDEDGFGMEEEYDWWLLDEDLRQIPGIPCWRDYSRIDMRANEGRWTALKNQAGLILKQGPDPQTGSSQEAGTSQQDTPSEGDFRKGLRALRRLIKRERNI